MSAQRSLFPALVLGFWFGLVPVGPGRAVAAAADACPGAASGLPRDLSARASAALAATPPDAATAVACLHAAEAAGDPGAAVALGHLAAVGLDGPADPTRAGAAFFRAAAAGSPQGVLAVGLAFAQGAGLPADPYWAAWFCRRAELLGGLTEAEREAAQAAVATAETALPQALRALLAAESGGEARP